jgi:von Willebrand factor type A domain
MSTLRIAINWIWVLSAVCLGLADLDTHAASPDVRVIKMLSGQNEAVRLRTLSLLQTDRERATGLIEDLAQVAREQAEATPPGELVRASTVELLYLIGSLKTPESESVLVELLDSAHFGIAMIATDVLGKHQLASAIENLKHQIDRPEYKSSYGFRFNLIRALAQMKHPDAVEFLDSLRNGLDGQLRFELDELLSKVDQADFQGDEERFATWQAAHEPKIVLRPAGFESESRQRLNLVPARQYYGIDINAKRMMFIIDHSGSMNERVGGYSRLDRAKVELINTIQSLPSDTKFAVAFYSDTVHQWRNELVEATDINKRQVVTFIQQLEPKGMTNTYGALRQSLEYDEQLEAVFLLTDGRPTMGEIVVPEAIIADIVHRNRFRHLKFNTVGIKVDGPTERFLRNLAEHAAGEFRQSQ